jgi:TolA-binding protein
VKTTTPAAGGELLLSTLAEGIEKAPGPGGGKLSPEEAKSQYDKAFALYRNKDYDRAIVEFEKITLSSGDDRLLVRAQYMLAESYFAAGRYEEAIPKYLSVALQPDQEDWAINARLKIAESYEREGKWDSAVSEYERAIRDHRGKAGIDPARIDYASERIKWIKDNKIRSQ